MFNPFRVVSVFDIGRGLHPFIVVEALQTSIFGKFINNPERVEL